MRQAAVGVQNNFRNGLVTEATGLNFPENACTDTYDCVFNYDGSVSRRLGFDFEADSTTKTIDRTNSVVTTYRWRNVAGNGNLTVFVVQVANKLYFYRMDASSISGGAVADTVTLTPVASAPATSTIEAQFSDGNGLLFVTHPYCEPMYISYDESNDQVTETNITIQIRDFEGAVADTATITERPTATLAALNVNHHYNLLNQGWTTTNLTAWDAAQTTMPSNADVMWRFKNASDDFDFTAAVLARITAGNTPAPKGHFILTLSNQDRDTASGLTGVAATTTSYQRPSTSAFFAGRVFYSGINYLGFNSKIYFTKVIESTKEYGYCYQVNDPTAEDLFDLLPTDGGVISIPDAGTIYKLVTIPGGLAVFAANGVWFITGSTGLGFTANDYTVQKISTVSTLSSTSFVEVSGYPSWWNEDGVYLMSPSQTGGMPMVQSMTFGKIKSFYDDIPLQSKKFARGFYNNVTGILQWLYKSEYTTDVTETYEFDRILNFNTFTGAFYPWTISTSDVKINAIVVFDATTGAASVDNVINDAADTVIDDSANNVIVFTFSGAPQSLTTKYLISYADSGSYKFTFAEEYNEDYLDWYQYDTTGVNYSSYFITGYELRGEGIRKFQSTWVKFFSRVNAAVSYKVHGIWDYAITGSGTGRYSSGQLVTQTVTHNNTDYSNWTRRLKIRGHGIALQFKIESVQGENFDIIGWTQYDTGNSVP